MITVADYFMGRREAHPLELTPDIERNAARTVGLANQLLIQAATYGVNLPDNPATNAPLTSGWRPPSVNANTPNAAARSMHMTGEAIDLYDPHGDMDTWLMTGEGQAALVALGLWLEHPASTKNWSHVQTRPPRSGNRVFYP